MVKQKEKSKWAPTKFSTRKSLQNTHTNPPADNFRNLKICSSQCNSRTTNYSKSHCETLVFKKKKQLPKKIPHNKQPWSPWENPRNNTRGSIPKKRLEKGFIQGHKCMATREPSFSRFICESWDNLRDNNKHVMYHHQTKKKKNNNNNTNTSFPTLNNLITITQKNPQLHQKTHIQKNKTFSKADVIPQTLQM